MKKGFTLIELLAVIVILAIIALIATPIVLDIIEDSKNSSIKRSIELYADAVENSVAKAQLNGSVVPSGKYTTTDGKTLTQGNTTIKVDYDGAKTVCEVNITNNGEVSLKNCKVNGKATEYTYGKDEDTNNKTYTNGEVVYFNVDNGTKCSNYTETQSNTGVNSGCMKFYVFNDDGGDTINLILDHNTTATVSWVSKADYVAAGGTESDYGSYGKNDKGPLTLLTQLKTDTDGWKGTITPSNYTMNQTGQLSNANYTIKYKDEGYKARLITAQEVATITDYSGWDEKTATKIFYFDTNTNTASTTCKSGNTSGCKFGWLYDRTATNCTKYGCLNNSDQATSSYWTASSRAGDSDVAWSVYFSACVTTNLVDSSSSFSGVRPVITILKSLIK